LIPASHVLTQAGEHTKMLSDMAKSLTDQCKAVSHPGRLALLRWLKDPVAHFPPQTDGDLITDGVCAVFIAERWGVSQPTASRHLKLLTDAGLIVATRKKGWVFYRRDEQACAALRVDLETYL
jgi:DNA-binding transcriptional ArsR family regulator